MAGNKEVPCSQGTATALQRLEGFANRLFHRHSKNGAHEQRAALENESQQCSEYTAQWDASSKCGEGFVSFCVCSSVCLVNEVWTLMCDRFWGSFVIRYQKVLMGRRAYCIRQGKMGAGSWTGGWQENLSCIPFSFKAQLTCFGEHPPQFLLLNYLFSN